FEHAALGPPENLVIALVGFTVAAVSAGDCAVPKTENHFLGGQLPPAILDVALVFYLVINNGLAIDVTIQLRAAGFFHRRTVLDARVRNPRQRVVEKFLAV